MSKVTETSLKHTIVLEAGREFHTNHGAIKHDDLIGLSEGSTVASTGNMTASVRVTNLEGLLNSAQVPSFRNEAPKTRRRML